MGEKSAQQRAAYFRNWKSGISRTKADETAVYIDEPVTNEVMARDRIMRQRTHMRQKAREQRKEDAKDLCASLRREIERLKHAPFSWQREST